MKLLHLSDLHLDCPISQIGPLDDEFQFLVTHHAQKVLHNVMQYLKAHPVDLLLISGDTFHQAHISYKMQEWWNQFLYECVEQKITPCIIFGNHDYYSKEYYWFSFPQGVLVWDSETVCTKTVVTQQGEKVAISAFSYMHSNIIENKLDEFPSYDQTADYHIAMYHGQQSGSYAPFSIEAMKQLNYDYIALGHIHRYQKLAERINYCGTPQGKRQGEWQKGKGILITLDNDFYHEELIDFSCFHVETKTITITTTQMDKVIENIKSQCIFNKKTILNLELVIDDSLGDTLIKELETSDFKEMISHSIAEGDMAIVQKINISKKTTIIPEQLAELKYNYTKKDVFMSVAPEIFHREASELQDMILKHKMDIVDEAFSEWLIELNGG